MAAGCIILQPWQMSNIATVLAQASTQRQECLSPVNEAKHQRLHCVSGRDMKVV